jgi:hypothetical protein
MELFKVTVRPAPPGGTGESDDAGVVRQPVHRQPGGGAPRSARWRPVGLVLAQPSGMPRHLDTGVMRCGSLGWSSRC